MVCETLVLQYFHWLGLAISGMWLAITEDVAGSMSLAVIGSGWL